MLRQKLFLVGVWFGKGGGGGTKAYILDRNIGRTVELALLVAEGEVSKEAKPRSFLSLFLDTQVRKKGNFLFFSCVKQFG